MTENSFVDAEAYQGGGNKDVTFEFVVLEHLRRITRLASNEWHGGKMIYRDAHIGNGGGSRQITNEAFYIESTSEAYSHAVECLMDLVLPVADDKLLGFEKENNSVIESLIDDLYVYSKTKFSTRASYEKAKHEALSQGQELEVHRPSARRYEDVKENNLLQRARRRRALFREIQLFFRRTDFFNSGGSYEEEVVA